MGAVVGRPRHSEYRGRETKAQQTIESRDDAVTGRIGPNVVLAEIGSRCLPILVDQLADCLGGSPGVLLYVNEYLDTFGGGEQRDSTHESTENPCANDRYGCSFTLFHCGEAAHEPGCHNDDRSGHVVQRCDCPKG